MTDRLNKLFIHQEKYSPEILDLLENTTIGTNGSKYRHLHTREKIKDLYKPHFFSIYRNQKAICNVTICERPLINKGQTFNSLYIRYFAFANIFQSSGKTKSRNRDSIFQQYVTKLFNTSNLNVESPEHKPSLFWAFIDPKNERSLNMAVKNNFESISKIRTMAFSRFFPKLNTNVERLKKSDQPETLNLIKEFYKDYFSLTTVHLFKDDNYFVFKKNGEILAGIQANNVKWVIEALPGIKGKILVKLLPYIPFLNKIINPKQYIFLATEGLFWKAGHEDKIEPLLNSVLKQQNCHSMLLWADTKNKSLINQLEKCKLGILEKLKNDNEVDIVAKFNHLDEQFIEEMKNSIHYISGFDTT